MIVFFRRSIEVRIHLADARQMLVEFDSATSCLEVSNTAVILLFRKLASRNPKKSGRHLSFCVYVLEIYQFVLGLLDARAFLLYKRSRDTLKRNGI